MHNKIVQLLNTALGANWRTSSSGLVALFCIILVYVVHNQPELIAFLPIEWQGYILGIFKIFAVVGGISFIILVKDAQVTGGKVPQTDEAEKHEV